MFSSICRDMQFKIAIMAVRTKSWRRQFRDTVHYSLKEKSHRVFNFSHNILSNGILSNGKWQISTPVSKTNWELSGISQCLRLTDNYRALPSVNINGELYQNIQRFYRYNVLEYLQQKVEAIIINFLLNKYMDTSV